MYLTMDGEIVFGLEDINQNEPYIEYTDYGKIWRYPRAAKSNQSINIYLTDPRFEDDEAFFYLFR